jgi:hypothetical protein
MEVHHHAHTPRKKCPPAPVRTGTHYLWEFAVQKNKIIQKY